MPIGVDVRLIARIEDLINPSDTGFKVDNLKILKNLLTNLPEGLLKEYYSNYLDLQILNNERKEWESLKIHFDRLADNTKRLLELQSRLTETQQKKEDSSLILKQISAIEKLIKQGEEYRKKNSF